MLFEAALLSVFLYLVGTGKNVRSAARQLGTVVGRSAGSLRRVRAEVDRVQHRMSSAGGEGIRNESFEVAERMRRLRAIQIETTSLLSLATVAPKTMPGQHPVAPFSDEELAAAMQGNSSSHLVSPPPSPADSVSTRTTPNPPNLSSPDTAPLPLASKVVYYHEGRPVEEASFEQVWDAGSSVPRGYSHEDVASAIRQGRDLEGSTGRVEPPPRPPLK